MRNKIIFTAAVMFVSILIIICAVLLRQYASTPEEEGEDWLECETDGSSKVVHIKIGQELPNHRTKAPKSPLVSSQHKDINDKSSKENFKEKEKQNEVPEKPSDDTSLPVNILIDARTPKTMSFADMETLFDFVEEETLKQCPFDYAKELKILCEELKLDAPPELADERRINKIAKEKALKLAEAKYPATLRLELLSKASQRFTLIKVGEKVTSPMRFGCDIVKIAGRVKSVLKEADTLKAGENVPVICLESGQKIPFIDLPEEYFLRLHPSGIKKLTDDYLEKHYETPRAEYIKIRTDEFKAVMYYELTKGSKFYELLKEKKNARAASAKQELLRKRLPPYLKEKLAFCKRAFTQRGKRKRYEKLFDEICLAVRLYGSDAKDVIKRAINVKKIKQIIAALAEDIKKPGSSSSENSKSYSGPLPVIPAYELIDNSEKYLGKTVVVTGMLSKTVKSAEGRRVDLCKGRVQCFPKDSVEDKRDFEGAGLYSDYEKKVYCNKASNYRDSLAKLTVKGVARYGLKPGTVMLESCKIIRWYAVILKGASRKRGGLRLTLYWKKQLLSLAQQQAPPPKASSGKAPATPENDTNLLVGILTLSKKTMRDRRLNIDKNKTVFMGDDPFSFLTEVHEINTVLKRKGWKRHLELTLKAKTDTGAVTNKHAAQYHDGQVFSWRSLTPKVKLYSIVNDAPLFRTSLLEQE